MNVLALVIEVLAIAGIAGIACRIDQMTWQTHQAAVVAMHVGMGFACLWAFLDAVEGVVNLGGVGAVVSTVCWLWTSLPTWAFGPPKHTMKHPDQVLTGGEK